VGLVCNRGCDIRHSLVGFVDSDYIDDLDKRRYLISYIFMFGGSTVSKKAILQDIIALSTCLPLKHSTW